MNLDYLINRMRIAAATLATIVMCHLGSSAILPLSFEILDPDIQVGESFEVKVSTTFDVFLELTSFALQIDPLGMLPGNRILSFQSWILGPGLEPSLFPSATVVEGYGDPFNPTFGTSNVLLATLSFNAMGSGSESVITNGLLSDLNGITLYDEDADSFLDYDLTGSFDVQVSNSATKVPDSSATLGLLSFGLLSLLVGRRFHKVI